MFPDGSNMNKHMSANKYFECKQVSSMSMSENKYTIMSESKQVF